MIMIFLCSSIHFFVCVIIIRNKKKKKYIKSLQTYQIEEKRVRVGVKGFNFVEMKLYNIIAPTRYAQHKYLTISYQKQIFQSTLRHPSS